MMEGIEMAPFEAWSDVLACPICREFPLGKVITCRVGHSFCEECISRQSSKTCSQCRSSLDGETTRNYVAEGILDNLTFPCPYREKGCEVGGLRRSEVKTHSNNCEHGGSVIRLCQRLGFPDCEEIFSFRDPRAYLEHVADGTHCSHKRVRENEGPQSLLIRSFRRIHEPDFVMGFSFLPKLFELDQGVKILVTYFVPLPSGGGDCTDLYFAAILMEDKRPATANSPYFVQFCAKGVGEETIMKWAQPVLELEKSREALEGCCIRVSISVLQQKCMRLEDSQLELKLKFRTFKANPGPPQPPPPPVHVRNSVTGVNEWARNLSPPARARFIQSIGEVFGLDLTPEEIAAASAAADEFLLSLTGGGRERRENGGGAGAVGSGSAPSYAAVARATPAPPVASIPSSFVDSIGAALRNSRFVAQRQPFVRVPRINVPEPNPSLSSGSSTNPPTAASTTSNLPRRAPATSTSPGPNPNIISMPFAENAVSAVTTAPSTITIATASSSVSTSTPPLSSLLFSRRLPPPPPRLSFLPPEAAAAPSEPPSRRCNRMRTNTTPHRRPPPLSPASAPHSLTSRRSRSPSTPRAESPATSSRSRRLRCDQSPSQLNQPPQSSDEDEGPRRQLRTRRPNSLHEDYFMY